MPPSSVRKNPTVARKPCGWAPTDNRSYSPTPSTGVPASHLARPSTRFASRQLAQWACDYSPVRLILDTMIWSRTADANAAAGLRRVLRESNADLLVHNGLLTEIGRNPNKRVRSEHLATVFALKPLRLRHESYVLAHDLIDAIRSHHPEWMRAAPDLSVDRRVLENEDRLWRAARYRPDAFGQASQLIVDGADKDTFAVQRFTRDEIRKAQASTPTLLSGSYEPTEADIEFFAGELPPRRSFEPWRLDVLTWWWEVLVRAPARARAGGAGLRSQIGAYVDLAAVFDQPGAFCSFVLDEVSPEDMPRAWTHWATDFLQPNVKVLNSNVWDAQHALWFADCDVFLTGDGRFARLANEVRDAGQVPLCQIIRVPTTESVVDDVATGLATVAR
jgi:hypothetical protein